MEEDLEVEVEVAVSSSTAEHNDVRESVEAAFEIADIFRSSS